MLETVLIDCPHCGESFETVADASAGTQEYIEDCYICCRPIVLVVEVDDAGDFRALRVRHPDE